MEMNFRKYLLESEEKENIKRTILKLPKEHQKLLHGCKFKFQGGNTLKGDNNHIGVFDKNKITVAAPWNYSREFTTLHEIGHLVWEHKMSSKLRKKWNELVHDEKKKMKKLDSLDQNPEEIFCMVYASVYTKHPPTTFKNDKWEAFIKQYIP